MASTPSGKSRATRKTQPVATKADKAAERSAVKVTKAKKPQVAITDETWREMVATAAYYRAQARERGSPERDWLEAEVELKQRFGKI
jgi:hypothetical protein